MEREILLSIRGTQRTPQAEPETIELTTEGWLARTETGYVLSYMESALTGLEGVKTEFLIAPDRIVLRRSGALQTQMVFAEGEETQSLYQMEFGALLVTICAKTVRSSITADGGSIELCYTLSIEDTPAGMIDYHIVAAPKTAPRCD